MLAGRDGSLDRHHNRRRVFAEPALSAAKASAGVTRNDGASFVRFGFGFPLAIAYVFGLHYAAGYAFPQLNGSFVFWAVLGGLAQIFATILLVYLFSLRNLRSAPPIRRRSRCRRRYSV